MKNTKYFGNLTVYEYVAYQNELLQLQADILNLENFIKERPKYAELFESTLEDMIIYEDLLSQALHVTTCLKDHRAGNLILFCPEATH